MSSARGTAANVAPRPRVAAAPWEFAQLVLKIEDVGIGKPPDGRCPRHQLMQQIEALGDQRIVVEGKEAHYGQIAAGAVHAGDKAAGDRIAGHDSDNGDRPADGLRCTRDGFGAASDDDARMPPDQVCDKARQQVVIAAGPAAFDRDITADSQPFVAEPANEPGQEARFIGFLRSIAEDTDDGLRRLLRPRREWPRYTRAGDECDEVPPFHRCLRSVRAGNWTRTYHIALRRGVR
jgi:hypothetical protein